MCPLKYFRRRQSKWKETWADFAGGPTPAPRKRPSLLAGLVSMIALLAGLVSMIARASPSSPGLSITYPFPFAVYIGSPTAPILRLATRLPEGASMVCLATTTADGDEDESSFSESSIDRAAQICGALTSLPSTARRGASAVSLFLPPGLLIHSQYTGEAGAGMTVKLLAWLADEQGEQVALAESVQFQRATGPLFHDGGGTFPLPQTRKVVVLGVFWGHDAHLALVVDGVVVEVLELERVTSVRHFMPDYFDPRAMAALLAEHTAAILARAGIDGLDFVVWAANDMCCDTDIVETPDMRMAFDLFSAAGSTAATSAVGATDDDLRTRNTDYWLRRGWGRQESGRGEGGGADVTPPVWVEVGHAQSHALLSLLDSPFEQPLVLVSDVAISLWAGVTPPRTKPQADQPRPRGAFFELRRLETPSHAHNLTLGIPYELVSLPLQEVTGGVVRVAERYADNWHKLGHEVVFSNAGKTMGYAGLGKVRKEWVDTMRRFMRHPTGGARGRRNGAAAGNMTRRGDVVFAHAKFKRWNGVRTPVGLQTWWPSSLSSASSSSCDSAAALCINDNAGTGHWEWTPLEDEDIQGHFPENPEIADKMDREAPPLSAAAGASTTWTSTAATAARTNRSEQDRDLAATLQHVFVDETIGLISPFLLRRSSANTSSSSPPSPPLHAHTYDGIAMGGGCALNVIANTAIEERLELAVSVPPAPNDAGIAVGAAWHVMWSGRQSLQYSGPELFDVTDAGDIVQETVLAHGSMLHAEKLQSGKSAAAEEDAASRLASLLVDEHMIVGVARGRMEHGPRALGHRSLLADATQHDIKHRLNVLKHREWWRPTAPMVAEEDAERVFKAVPRVSSPYMSFAPKLTDEAAQALPGIAHFDGTARPQIVSQEDEPWLHALLLEVRRRCGWAVLINTSFNTKGRPILNSAGEALGLLVQSPELDAVVVEDWLVLKSKQVDGRCRVAVVVDGLNQALDFPPGQTGDQLRAQASSFVRSRNLSGGPGCKEGDYECATSSLVALMRQRCT